MKNFNEYIVNNYENHLKNLREKNLYRSLKKNDLKNSCSIQSNKKKLISFASNDYLDLASNKLVKKSAINAIKKYGLGAKSSRYITGNNYLYHQLEKQLSKLKNCEDCLIFSSGYMVAIGVISALINKDDLIIADHLIHSCLLDGAKLSGAKLIRFRHNDLEHCEKILQENRSKFKKCLIISETVFSMDGDLGKIPGLLILAKKFNTLLLSDDAHGFGLKIFDSEIVDDCHLQMGTLSKAFASLGGYVAGNGIIIDYLRNFAKSQIYSTALPPAILAGALTALEIINADLNFTQKNNLKELKSSKINNFQTSINQANSNQTSSLSIINSKTKNNFNQLSTGFLEAKTNKKIYKSLGQKALDNANLFCNLMGFEPVKSPIVIVIVKEAKLALEIQQKLLENKIIISAIRYPTVAKNSARLRISFNANHQKNHIVKLANLLKKLLKI